MKPDDFFEEEPQHAEDWVPRLTLRENLLDDARRGPIRDVDDLSLGLAITELAHREFEAFGTDGSTSLSEHQTRLLLRTLKAVLARLGIPVDFPWRDFSTFKTHWLEQGCYGSWQARRDLLNRHFDPIEARLYALEERAYLDELAEAVSLPPATRRTEPDAA